MINVHVSISISRRTKCLNVRHANSGEETGRITKINSGKKAQHQEQSDSRSLDSLQQAHFRSLPQHHQLYPDTFWDYSTLRTASSYLLKLPYIMSLSSPPPASQPTAGKASLHGYPLPATAWLQYLSCLLREALEEIQRQTRRIDVMIDETGETSDDELDEDNEEVMRLYEASTDYFYDFLLVRRTLFYIDPETFARFSNSKSGESSGSDGAAGASS